MVVGEISFRSSRQPLNSRHASCWHSWLLALALGVLLTGCREERKVEDEIVGTFAFSKLEEVAGSSAFPTRYQERAKAALLELKTREVSSEPMFIYARISRGDEPNEYRLNLMCFDEARDLQGIRVREQHGNAGETTDSITEDYPIFVDWLESWTLERRVIPITIRKAGQRKSEDLWLKYENRCLNEVIQGVLASKHGPSETSRPRERISVQDMPPLYMSLPDPNRVKVEICAYDKEGRESKWIDVDYWR